MVRCDKQEVSPSFLNAEIYRRSMCWQQFSKDFSIKKTDRVGNRHLDYTGWPTAIFWFFFPFGLLHLKTFPHLLHLYMRIYNTVFYKYSLDCTTHISLRVRVYKETYICLLSSVLSHLSRISFHNLVSLTQTVVIWQSEYWNQNFVV